MSSEYYVFSVAVLYFIGGLLWGHLLTVLWRRRCARLRKLKAKKEGVTL